MSPCRERIKMIILEGSACTAPLYCTIKHILFRTKQTVGMKVQRALSKEVKSQMNPKKRQQCSHLSLRKLFDWEPCSAAPSKALSHHFGNALTLRGKEWRSERQRGARREQGRAKVEISDVDKWRSEGKRVREQENRTTILDRR